MARTFILLAAFAALPRLQAAVALEPTPTSAGAVGAFRFELDERVACQRAIEEVYWRHRLWPAGNPGVKPPPEAVLSPRELLAKAEEAVLKSWALAVLTRRPISGQDLRAEVERMARATRSPETLSELWAVLENDPLRIAECLARPLLADRRLREWYASEPAAHAKAPFEDWWLKVRGNFSLEPLPITADFDLPAIASEACSDDTWASMRFEPDSRKGHVAVWTGAEMLVWGGQYIEVDSLRPGARYDPVTDTWHPMSLINAPSNRQDATGVWTGTELIVWGGLGGGATDNLKDTGGRYNPASDSWTPTSLSGTPPCARAGHTSVWSGSDMIVWGGWTSTSCSGSSGFLDSGALYDPGSDTWSAVSTVGAPSARASHTAVWTGSHMVVWGGSDGSVRLNTGGRYDPGSNTWQATSAINAPEARSLHSAVWSGSRMIVWGGCGAAGCFSPLATGGRYDPSSDSWLSTTTSGAPQGRRFHAAVWAGSRMIVWGGCVDNECSSHRSSGGRYDPGADSWQATSTVAVPSARSRHAAIWTGAEMIIWGGCGRGECQGSLGTGSRYNPSSDLWVAIGSQNSPSARLNHTAVWTGAEMIVWGGYDALGPTASGRRFDPATDSWGFTPVLGAPFARQVHTVVWTGTEMIVWGGSVAGIGSHNSGGRYNPASDTWAETSQADAPAGRESHTAVWTGTEMIVWGGCAFSGCGDQRNDGGRYDPMTDSWTAVSAVAAPTKRAFHTAVWSGEEMIVFGGFPLTSTGGRYSPTSNSWRSTTLSGAPSPRDFHSAVWTGTEMIVWGGKDDVAALATGGLYDPAGDFWRPVSTSSAPAGRSSHTGVWTGKEMIIWGGCADAACTSQHFTGGRYDPALDVWSPTSTGAFAPFERGSHEAVWTGTEMIVWGGHRGTASNRTNTGSRYCANAIAAEAPGEAGRLLMEAAGGGALRLSWSPSCTGQATDYAVYRGTLGSFDSHSPLLCSTGGASEAVVIPSSLDEYYLVVPLGESVEGLYGADSSGAERPRAVNSCRPSQNLAACP